MNTLLKIAYQLSAEDLDMIHAAGDKHKAKAVSLKDLWLELY